MSSTSAEDRLTGLYRTEWGRLVARLVVRTRRIDLVEDAVAEAFARAADRWPVDGVPTNPAGWLYTVAHRAVVGVLRSESSFGRAAPRLAARPGWVPPADDDGPGLTDDRLELILLCCHPALAPHSQSALALRLVIGTTTEQIARLFCVPTPTMAARLTRAKRKIALAGIPLASPVEQELASRLDEVCRTIYLAFTAGYSPSEGTELLRADLAGDAVRLAGVLHSLVPGAPQARALHALLLLQHCRRDARVVDGRLVLLADQDRTRWHGDELRHGLALVEGLIPTTGHGEELRLQAMIAAEHARAADAAQTDWLAIATHYERLERLTGSPVVRLNRAVAVAEVDGPQVALALLDDVRQALAGHHRVAAVEAELARRSGDHGRARAAYRRAIELCGNATERAFLAEQLAALDP